MTGLIIVLNPPLSPWQEERLVLGYWASVHVSVLESAEKIKHRCNYVQGLWRGMTGKAPCAQGASLLGEETRSKVDEQDDFVLRSVL